MDTPQILVTLGISLGLGLLVGLQRERKGEQLAGIRTFALLTITGTLAGLIARQFGPSGVWIVASGAVALGLIMAVGAWNKAHAKVDDLGLTTEIAALLMYGLGAYLVEGDRVAAVVVGGAVVLLLYWKAILHGFVVRLGDRDVSAIMTFVLIALVIWPLLPRQRIGPFGFFNPFETWLVVVLVVGMSLGGYVLYKLVPPTAGALLGGAVGGMVSSTATTVSYARRSAQQSGNAALAAQAIMMANTVSILRVIVLLLLFAQSAAFPLIPPLAVMAGAMLVLGLLAFWLGRNEHAALPPQENPTELKAALLFAAIYTLVKLATAWGKQAFGTSALYVVAAISGLTDVDAITLSMSDATRTPGAATGPATDTAAAFAPSAIHLEPSDAWRIILVAILANLLFKGATVLVLGNARLKFLISCLFGGALAAGIVILFAWK